MRRLLFCRWIGLAAHKLGAHTQAAGWSLPVQLNFFFSARGGADEITYQVILPDTQLHFDAADYFDESRVRAPELSTLHFESLL